MSEGDQQTDTTLGENITVDLRADDESGERLGRLHDAVASLTERVKLNDEQIDVLQAHAALDATPWYKRASTWSVLVAVIAIVFSGWTTLLSSQRLAAEDVQNDRAEVRELLQRLSQVEAESVVSFSQLDARTAEALSNTVGIEQLLLARQALEVMQRIPDHVTSNEYWLVGNTLMLLDKYADAEIALGLAIQEATDTGDNADRIQALQTRAQNAFLQQRFTDGRAQLTEALAVYEEFPPSSNYLVPFTAAQIELLWAQLEHTMGNCDMVEPHLEAARVAVGRVLDVLTPGLLAGIDQIANAPCVIDGSAG